MKRIEFTAAAIATFLLVSSAPAESPRVSTFLITIDRTDEGLSMSCSEGCAWKTLNVGGCKPKEECRFVLDQNGMR
jgi:hypothetical protein